MIGNRGEPCQARVCRFPFLSMPNGFFQSPVSLIGRWATIYGISRLLLPEGIGLNKAKSMPILPILSSREPLRFSVFCSSEGRRARHRQNEREGGPLAYLAFHLDLTPMLVHDLIGDREAQACSL